MINPQMDRAICTVVRPTCVRASALLVYRSQRHTRAFATIIGFHECGCIAKGLRNRQSTSPVSACRKLTLARSSAYRVAYSLAVLIAAGCTGYEAFGVVGQRVTFFVLIGSKTSRLLLLQPVCVCVCV